MEAIGQLTGGIAHDFNNLLGVIIGNAEFLIDAARGRPDAGRSGQGDPEQRAQRRRPHAPPAGLRAPPAVAAAADRPERLSAEPRRHPASAARRDDHASRRALASDLWPTRADPSQVGDALLNLAINARDAMPHGGSISIETANVHAGRRHGGTRTATARRLRRALGDGHRHRHGARSAGTGVEPFFTTKGPGAGSGLGLSMIYGFARQSGGHLQDRQRARATAPRCASICPSSGRRSRRAASSAESRRCPAATKSILLVDDNAEMRAVARRHLASLGYRVTEAEKRAGGTGDPARPGSLSTCCSPMSSCRTA